MSDFWIGFGLGIIFFIVLEVIAAVILYKRMAKKFRRARFQIDKKQEQRIDRITKDQRWRR